MIQQLSRKSRALCKQEDGFKGAIKIPEALKIARLFKLAEKKQKDYSMPPGSPGSYRGNILERIANECFAVEYTNVCTNIAQGPLDFEKDPYTW